MPIVPDEIDAAADLAAIAESTGKPRAVTYSDEVFLALCLRLSQGRSLRNVCSDDDMPSQASLFRWLADDEHPRSAWMREQYARATDARADAIFEDTLNIADDAEGKEANAIQAAKLRIETRRWFLGKLRPKKYGDKVALTGGAPDDEPIQQALTVRFVRANAT